jgi:hypothetical protein
MMKKREIREQIEIIEKIFQDGIKKCKEGMIDIVSAISGLRLVKSGEVDILDKVDISRIDKTLDLFNQTFKEELPKVKKERFWR